MRTEMPGTATPLGPATVTTNDALLGRSVTPSTSPPRVTAARATSQRRAGAPRGGKMEPDTGAMEELAPRRPKSVGTGAGRGIGGRTLRAPPLAARGTASQSRCRSGVGVYSRPPSAEAIWML